jgi:hypothetical protein
MARALEGRSDQVGVGRIVRAKNAKDAKENLEQWFLNFLCGLGILGETCFEGPVRACGDRARWKDEQIKSGSAGLFALRTPRTQRKGVEWFPEFALRSWHPWRDLL